MSVGPITIFDKSAIQGLSIDEAVWFGNFFRMNVCPVFFVETLADLDKETAKGRTPEQVVGGIASKFQNMTADPNVHHQRLCLADLMEASVEQRRFAIIDRGVVVREGNKTGVRMNESDEVLALRRWQRGEFMEVERDFARAWRKSLEKIDLPQAKLRFAPAVEKLGNPKSLEELRKALRVVVDSPEWSEAALLMCLNIQSIPFDYWIPILRRWNKLRRPPLSLFSPYAAHVLVTDLIFYVGIAKGLLPAEKSTNKIDLSYLYYLPFCMVFTSGDKFHRMVAPLLLNEDQAFVWAPDLKQALAELDKYYDSFPQEEKQRGVMSFAQDPPVDLENLVSRLWDQFLPRWRERPKYVPMSAESEKALVKEFQKLVDAPETNEPVDLESAQFVLVQQRWPVRMGKWRLLPPELEKREQEPST